MKSEERIREKRKELAKKAYRSPKEKYVEVPETAKKVHLLDWVLGEE